jgi:hypothetical protein
LDIKSVFNPLRKTLLLSFKKENKKRRKTKKKQNNLPNKWR